jgi:DNA-binding GntR family transcriptional regulator
MSRDGASIAKITEALEEDILFGRLRSRERLVEDDLIDRFKATRHHVRLALAELERMGIVNRIPNKGAVVRDFTLEEIEQICAVRELLHDQAASMIPLPADPGLLRRLETLHRAHTAAVGKKNPREIHHINNQFHETLFAACGNTYLARTIADYARLSLAFRCHLMVNPVLASKARDEHAAMIEALKQGQRDILRRL